MSLYLFYYAQLVKLYLSELVSGDGGEEEKINRIVSVNICLRARVYVMCTCVSLCVCA